MTGLISSTGVPSIASSPRRWSFRPSTDKILQVVKPIRFGRFLPRWAKMPIFGQSVWPRGCRAPVSIFSSGTRSKRKMISAWEKVSRPASASEPNRSGSSSMDTLTASQSSSIGWSLSDRTQPIGWSWSGSAKRTKPAPPPWQCPRRHRCKGRQRPFSHRDLP